MMAAPVTPDPVTVPKKITTELSARRKLELSSVSLSALQQELMGTDVGIEKLAVYLSSQIRFDVGDRITDASISRSMDASSTLTVTIDDYDRGVLLSGYLHNKLDVTIDGLWFRLLGVDKQGDTLVLTFEDREIAVLRTYNSWKVARRSQVTRAEFVLSLITEVKEFQIPTIIPELHTVQPLQRYTGDPVGADSIMYKRQGINPDYQKPSPKWYAQTAVGKAATKLYCKTAVATKDQIQNANIIIGVGIHMSCNRKVIVSAIMTAIQESGLTNLPLAVGTYSGTSSGLFQQTIGNNWGSAEDRMNPETASRMYYQRAKASDAQYPHLSLNDLCYSVQHCAPENKNLYAQWADQADAFVTAHGMTGGDIQTGGASSNGQNDTLGAGGEYFFYRGTIDNRLGQKIRKPENSWTCIQRLAGDVNWKGFFVSGFFYFMSEDDLIKQQPAATINEWTDGIISIDGNYYENKNNATLTVTADVGRWMVPPGRLVVIKDMGVWDGRWLVTQFDRSLFNLQATISLERKHPALPEPNPKGGNKSDVNPTWVPKEQSVKVGTTAATATDGTRTSVVLQAKKAVEVNKTWHYHYHEIRPYPDSMWSAEAHNRGFDCSAFVTLCYKEGGAPDPNGSNFDGNGYTGTLAKHGKTVTTPKPGDIQLYGDPPGYGHATIYIGDGLVASFGSEAGPETYSATDPAPALIKSYLP